MLTGPDVSHFQSDVDMHAVKNAGHSLVGIKSTEGIGYLDAKFTRNRTNAREAGLVRLLYHFARPSRNKPSSEAAWYVQHIGTLEPGEIAVLDTEDPNASGDLSAWTLEWLDAVRQMLGRVPVLYTYAPYARLHLRASRLGTFPLWLAAYGSVPAAPAPWPAWVLWQYTSSGSCPGITGRCDLNRFHGSLDELHALAGMEDDMFTDQDRALLQSVKDWIDKMENGVPLVGVEPLPVSTSQAHRNTKKIAAKLGITDAE